ncbi:DUF3536 domain-containing protein [cf. Phormidesmis sp. LEGE 11477]|uniref:DUF3536 domain-containing protein n=1 Tax=cf. Phormidesmis sp. LEGE 11477 TaxID=1828680 RepID=UPI001880DDA6|nr:DUF3536 domain-containing protein [cf. Phormidesmis sp. LEGE 11477]MBE9060451.1 DUF3536 domain-containing protein [cf. Phormidesmis sp. LEGE 11477]
MSKSQSNSAVESISAFDPRQSSENPSQHSSSIAAGVYVCIHGHFYQPPREDPARGVVSKQPSASPFHDWNERILYESYRPNAFARILNGDGEVTRIVNNYEHISFNIGPTLMSWLARHDLETYRRILAADKVSCDRNQGHGNAIAQAYNHIILPLANHRDKVTQIRWGIADFQHRFGRDPEGMWLAETAVDNDTLAVLINEGIQFIILAPSQAAQCRRFGLADGFDEWQLVENGDIDPTQPYRCFVPAQPNGRNYIDIFFYDGPISGDMGFDDTLRSSQQFANRLGQAVRSFEIDTEAADWTEAEKCQRRSQLISVATDGETFGHHRGGAEKTLAHTVINELPNRGWQVTSYAHYLSMCPPTWEVQLKPVTAWSCSHGVDRWQRDCGCGGGGAWQQQWRAPLRQALDWLRDRLIPLYEKLGGSLLQDPWAARNDYVNVLNSSSTRTLDQFFAAHQSHPLTYRERVEALRLLEMQRHTMLMYTSCGWFFDEISRPEGTQILRYAARAIELAEAVSGNMLENEFVQRLAQAPSNIDYFKTGAGVYQKQVKPSQTSLERIVAHYATGSLFTPVKQEEQLYCYTLRKQDYYQQPLGALTLAVGRVEVTTAMTQETQILSFAVLHLGGWDFQCKIQAFAHKGLYAQAKKAVIEAFSTASIAQSILAIDQQFSQTYTLQDLSQEERQQIMQQLNHETLQRLNQLYEQVYRENYSVLMAFHRDRITVPQSLQVAADITLSQRALAVIHALEQNITEPDGNLLDITVGRIAELEGIATEAHHFCASLKVPDAQPVLERLIWQSLSQTLQTASPEQYLELEAAIEGIERLIKLGAKLNLELALYRVQELYYDYLAQQMNDAIAGQKTASPRAADHQISSHKALLVRLGWALALDTEAVLAQTT